MSAAENALAALEAAGKAATPRPWTHMGGISQSSYPYDDVVSVEESRGWEATSNLNIKDEDANLICRAVNLSAPLAAVARAAMAERAAEDAFHAFLKEGYDDAQTEASRLYAVIELKHAELRTALDALEAAAEGVV